MRPRPFPLADQPRLARIGCLAAVLACLWLGWSAAVRAHHCTAVSALPGRAEPDRPDARSPTGRPAGQRELIVAGRNEESFDWIAQTQAMLAGGPARIRRVDYDNAPHGRPVSAASPYRWYLGLVAAADHAATGRPLGLAVERAALVADPLLQGLALLAFGGFTLWAFGGLAAGLLAVGWVAFFPLASSFVPGMPDGRGLALALALASLLALAAGLRPAFRGQRPARLCFALAGVAGGLGIWVNVGFEAPLLLGAVVAAMLASIWPPVASGPVLPWRAWGLAGGLTILAAYAAEYFPAELGAFDLTVVHPAYGIALMGAGEMLALLEEPPRARTDPGHRRWLMRMAGAVAAILVVPVLMTATKSAGFLTRDLLWAQLSRLPGSPVESGTAAWLGHGGGGLSVAATLLPLGAVLGITVTVLRGGAVNRRSAFVLLGPLGAAVILAVHRLEWWSLVQVAALVAIVAALETLPRRLVLAATVAVAAAAGLTVLWPATGPAALQPTAREAEELVDRHLAHWLVQRSGGPGTVVLAPPHVSAALDFYGSLRGLGSFAPDNHAGFEAALGVAVARTMEEIEQDLAARQVRFLILPSWDPFFQQCGRQYLGPLYATRTLLADELRQWHLPAWLRPIPYQSPVEGGAAVLVFEVVPPQGPALAAGRLTEYLVEMGNLEAAGAVADGLKRFPGDVGALVARAELENARGNTVAFAQATDLVLARLGNAGDRYLPWDRRVGLAVVLAQSDHGREARVQLQRCLAEATADRLRSLSTGALYALLQLSQLLQADFPRPDLRDVAVGLLPGDLRARL